MVTLSNGTPLSKTPMGRMELLKALRTFTIQLSATGFKELDNCHPIHKLVGELRKTYPSGKMERGGEEAWDEMAKLSRRNSEKRTMKLLDELNEIVDENVSDFRGIISSGGAVTKQVLDRYRMGLGIIAEMEELDCIEATDGDHETLDLFKHLARVLLRGKEI